MLKETKTISVLGTKVRIDFRKEQDDPKLKNFVGYYDGSASKIVVKILEQDAMSTENLDGYQKEILRHEIFHAFLHESGLDSSSGPSDNWATNEEMVDWFAIQSPKIFKVFQELGVM